MKLISQETYRNGMTVSIAETENGTRYEVRDYAATDMFPAARSYYRNDRRRGCGVRLTERSASKLRSQLDAIVPEVRP